MALKNFKMDDYENFGFSKISWNTKFSTYSGNFTTHIAKTKHDLKCLKELTSVVQKLRRVTNLKPFLFQHELNLFLEFQKFLTQHRRAYAKLVSQILKQLMKSQIRTTNF